MMMMMMMVVMRGYDVRGYHDNDDLTKQ